MSNWSGIGARVATLSRDLLGLHGAELDRIRTLPAGPRT